MVKQPSLVTQRWSPFRARPVQISWCTELPWKNRSGNENGRSSEERWSIWRYFVQEASQHKHFLRTVVTMLRALAAGLGGGFVQKGGCSTAELPWANCGLKRCNQPEDREGSTATCSNYSLADIILSLLKVVMRSLEPTSSPALCTGQFFSILSYLLPYL